MLNNYFCNPTILIPFHPRLLNMSQEKGEKRTENMTLSLLYLTNGCKRNVIKNMQYMPTILDNFLEHLFIHHFITHSTFKNILRTWQYCRH